MEKKEKIRKIIADENIVFIRLLFTDLNGKVKNVEVPSSHIDEILNNKIRCDGSSIEGFLRIVESDMILEPDIDTFKIYHYEKNEFGKMGGFICNVLTFKGETFLGDPRTLLISRLEQLSSYGFKSFNIGFEPEFYVLDKKGELSDNGSYFDLAPLDAGVNLRREIALELIKSGFDVEASHHEVGPGQHEITFRFADALKACDNLQLLKLFVKNVAHRHNYIATFMPKFKEGIAGSGMHVNMSISDNQGNNLFYQGGELSSLAKQFINGILFHAREIAAVTNPSINSYKRLFSGFEAPCYIAYSKHNRSALIRIPAVMENNARAELRMVDPAANPYLAIAVILEAGLDGIKRQLDTYKDITEDIFQLSIDKMKEYQILPLPNNLEKALQIAKSSDFIKGALGETIFHKYILLKEKEIRAHFLDVSDWEIRKYLDI